MRVLRAAFFVLLLGNLLLFAHGQGFFGRTNQGEAERLAAQLQPEKLRVVAVGAPPAAVPEGCRALAGLSQAQAQALAALLQGRDGEIRFAPRALEEPGAWWVHLPPQANAQQAEKKAAELKQLGVAEFFVVQEAGANRHAISLGLFKSAQGARERLEALHGLGVRSARIEVRVAPTGRWALEARGAPARLEQALAGLPEEYAAAKPAECARP